MATAAGSAPRHPPPHIRSRDALLALHSQASRDSSSHDPSHASLQSQGGAGQHAAQDSEAQQASLQQSSQLQGAYPQPAVVTAFMTGSRQLPGQDMFPGDLNEDDSQSDLHQYSPRHSMPGFSQNGHGSDSYGGSAGGHQHMPARRSMHYGRPRDAINAVRRAGSQDSHMSPFAGFAALTMARNSIDGRPDHTPGGNGYRSRRMSLEQAVGKDKFIKAVPQHARKSIDAAPPVRKSLENQHPPPASSSGMRNSRPGHKADTAEQSSARWSGDRRRQWFDSSQEQQYQSDFADSTFVPGTILESPSLSTESQQADNPPQSGTGHQQGAGAACDQEAAVSSAAAQAPQLGASSSGLSQYSPFANSALMSAPSFE